MQTISSYVQSEVIIIKAAVDNFGMSINNVFVLYL